LIEKCQNRQKLYLQGLPITVTNHHLTSYCKQAHRN